VLLGAYPEAVAVAQIVSLAVTLIAPVYAVVGVQFAVAAEHHRIDAPEVPSVMVALCGSVYAPVAGAITGAAVWAVL
jgi:hypothetical protein